jgi:hypothetical protein
LIISRRRQFQKDDGVRRDIDGQAPGGLRPVPTAPQIPHIDGHVGRQIQDRPVQAHAAGLGAAVQQRGRLGAAHQRSDPDFGVGFLHGAARLDAERILVNGDDLAVGQDCAGRRAHRR